MKISGNISLAQYRWFFYILRASSVLCLVLAVAMPQRYVDFLAFSGVFFLVSLLHSVHRSNFLMEVYDCGDSLKLKLDNDELSVNLYEIERVEISDGKGDLDRIAIHLCFETKFGRSIEFYPKMAMDRRHVDIWIAKFNERISTSRSAREC